MECKHDEVREVGSGKRSEPALASSTVR